MKKCWLGLKILNGNEISALIKGHNSGTNLRKIRCNNPKLDIAKMNAYEPRSVKTSLNEEVVKI